MNGSLGMIMAVDQYGAVAAQHEDESRSGWSRYPLTDISKRKDGMRCGLAGAGICRPAKREEPVGAER